MTSDSNTVGSLTNGATSDAAASAGKSAANLQGIFHPVVFQCRQCRTIVADSSDLLAADARHRHVVFRREEHANIVVQPEWHLEQDGFAFGSVYQKLLCRNCDREVGVRYHTTNAELDHLRGMLTLKTECLFVYELQFDDEQVQRDLAAIASHNEDFGTTSASSKNTAQPAAQEEIVKLQKFCLVLYDRLVKLETQMLAMQQQQQP